MSEIFDLGVCAPQVKTLVQSERFNNAITFCICVNMGMMAIDHYGMHEGLARVLEKMNLVLSIVFMVEMVLKLTGLGLISYWLDPWNGLDGGIVTISVVELIMGGSNSGLRYCTSNT